MTPDYTVYTAPHCTQCMLTKRLLTQHRQSFEEIALDQHPDVRDQLIAQGFKAAPVVVHRPTGQTWSGFRPDLIDLTKKKTA